MGWVEGIETKNRSIYIRITTESDSGNYMWGYDKDMVSFRVGLLGIG